MKMGKFIGLLLTFVIIFTAFDGALFAQERKKSLRKAKAANKVEPKMIDLTNKIGLGANLFLGSDIMGPVSSFSVKYWFHPRMGFQFTLGFLLKETTEEVEVKERPFLLEKSFYEYDLAGRFLLNLIQKKYYNFYCAAGGGAIIIDRYPEGDDGASLSLNGAAGIEWFLPWIRKLGIDLELGVDYRNIAGDFTIGTTSSLFGVAGFHYYF